MFENFQGGTLQVASVRDVVEATYHKLETLLKELRVELFIVRKIQANIVEA